MTIWDVHAPPTVKGPNHDAALATARKQTTVTKVPATDVPAEPPAPTYLAHDDCTNPDVQSLWGPPYVISPDRLELHPNGGPANKPFRRIIVKSGDDPYNEGHARGQIGAEYPTSGGGRYGTFYAAKEGEHRVYRWWMRLAPDFPIDTDSWQVLMQLKGAGVAGSPALDLQVRKGVWALDNLGTEDPPAWSYPAKTDTWTEFTYEVIFSSSPAIGRVRMTSHEEGQPTLLSPLFWMQTMRPGAPAHFDLGIYRDKSIPGSYVDISDIRVS